jgi:transcription initiation factor IIF auxiliary subunit
MRKPIYNRLSVLVAFWTLFILISPAIAQIKYKSNTNISRRIKQDISTENTSYRINQDQWEWTVFIKANDQAALKNIRCVEYKPQSSTTNRGKKVCTRGAGDKPFAYSGKSLGTFDIYVTILFYGKQPSLTLKHSLKL